MGRCSTRPSNHEIKSWKTCVQTKEQWKEIVDLAKTHSGFRAVIEDEDFKSHNITIRILSYLHRCWTFPIISFWLKRYNTLEDGSASVIR
jgi:hypothetical protein